VNPFDYAQDRLRSVSREGKCKNQNVKSKIMEALRADFYGGQRLSGLVNCGLKECRYQGDVPDDRE